MNKIVYDLLLKLEQCDDFHNRCDYLMEHDEITYLLEYIEEKDKQLDKYKNVIDKIKELIERKLSTETYQHLKKLYDDIDSTEEIWEDYEFEDLLDILELLEEVE